MWRKSRSRVRLLSDNRSCADGAATMKRVTLELGGKSPTILLDDAALDKTIRSALILAFMNSGQASCCRNA